MRAKILLYSKITLASMVFFLTMACSTPKDVTYFQDINEAVIPTSPSQGNITVEPGDKLSIVVKSKNPELSALFNLDITTNRSTITNRTGVGGGGAVPYTTSNDGMGNYTVSPEGTIDFPLLGTIKVAGMTRDEVAAYIKGMLNADMVKDAVVIVEFLNMGFSVMGEVNRPGRYDFNMDRLTILQALSIAGDLTIQGRRENVMVVRNEGNEVKTYRVDLTNARDLIKSPAYNLKQGDVIYVEPNDVRKRQTTVNGNNILSWSFWVSVASLLTSIAVLIVK